MNIYDFEERKSLILFVKQNESCFVCNRNSDMWNLIFNDKYVNFWNPNDVECSMNINDGEVELLEICDCDNYNLRDQKYLNERKKYWIDKLQTEEYEDAEWANVMLNKSINNYRSKYYNMYVDFRHCIDNIPNLIDRCYKLAKKLYFKDNNTWFLEMNNLDIWNYDKINKEDRAICIILCNYLLNRRNKKYKYPFDSGDIRYIIKYLIKKVRI